MGNKIKVPGIIKARHRNLSANLKQNKKTIDLPCYVNAGVPEKYRPSFTIKQCPQKETDVLKILKDEVLEIGKELRAFGESSIEYLKNNFDDEDFEEKSDEHKDKIGKITEKLNKKKNECFEILLKYLVDWDNFINLEEEVYVDFEEEDGHISKKLFYETVGHPLHEVGFQLVHELIAYSSEIPESINEQVKS
jgi:hypothetical protein